MSCGFPIHVHDRLRPCGKCQGCLRKRRNAWTGRMLLEDTAHEESSFVTLTYDDQHLPTVYHEESDQWIPTLVKSHCQNWIRSVRQNGTWLKPSIRYFAAGEYGEKSGRPHYHLIVFGIGPSYLSHFEESWKRGFVSAYPTTPRTMAYVAKYCLKKSADPELLLPTSMPQSDVDSNRVSVRPFRLMSRNPAIGAGCAPNIARALSRATGGGRLYDPEKSGSANRVRIQGKKYPLDKTVKQYLEAALLEEGVNEYQVHAMLNRDYEDPTDEEIEKAATVHRLAIRKGREKRSRAKL